MNELFFIQISFAAWFFLLHFISIPPLNDIDKFPNKPRWKLFLFANWVLQMLLILGGKFVSPYFAVGLLVYWSLLLMGHLNTWWLPYLFGWPKVFVEDGSIDHKATIRFLPPRENRPVPDLGYCIFGVLLTIACVFTWRDVIASF